MRREWPVWREITIPAHKGTKDLLHKVEAAGMHVESWARELMLARPFSRRVKPVKFRVARVPSTALGFSAEERVSIMKTKSAGLAMSNRLWLLGTEKILALRLGYKDQPREWMRLAMETFVDKDKSWLELALVNDGARLDIRTTWAYPENTFQATHEWLWEI